MAMSDYQRMHIGFHQWHIGRRFSYIASAGTWIATAHSPKDFWK